MIDHEANEFANWRVKHTYPRMPREDKSSKAAWYVAGALMGLLLLAIIWAYW